MSYTAMSKAFLKVLPGLACVFLASCGSGSATDPGSASAAGSTNVAPSSSITPPPVIAATQITAFAASGSNTKITSPNSLSPGDVVVITGTKNYNGTFSVVSATGSDFVINTAFVANDGTGYWQPGGGLIAGCSTTGDTNFISPAGLPSRVNGVAPLAIFFDATSTSATTTTNPFHELSYQWDFGDPGSGNWTYGSGRGSNSRNTAYGPVAAHVFDSAGTYLINLTVTDGTHTVSNQCLRVAVQDPPVVFAGTKTTCVSSASMPSAGFDGCPSGAAVAQQSDIGTIIGSYCGNGKRVLLKHDDTFTGSNPTLGNGCEINMYGSGAKPILSGAMIQIGSGSAVIDDARLVNMDVENIAYTQPAINIFNNAYYNSNILIYKTKYHNCTGTSQDLLDTNVSVTAPNSGIFVVDNVFDHCAQLSAGAGGEGVKPFGRDIVVMGNDVIGSGNNQQHLFRTQYADRLTLNNNSFSNGPSDKETVAIRSVLNPSTGTGSTWVTNNPGVHTQYVVVSDNDLQVDQGYAALDILPNSATDSSSAVLTDVIVERNFVHFPSGTNANSSLAIHGGTRITIRDNIVNMTNNQGNTYAAVGVSTQNGAPQDYAWIYNNTFYRNDATGYGGMIQAGSGQQHVIAVNNLAYYPTADGSHQTFVSVPCTTGCSASNNTSNVLTTPSFTNGSGAMLQPSDFKPNTGSYAIGAGASIPVWLDIFNRPVPSPRDMGAVSH